MAVTNATIAELLRNYASVLLLEGVDRFKVKAYRRAADTLESISDDVVGLVARGGDLMQFPGIGKAISAKIEEIVKTGRLLQLENSIARMPVELAELATRPALDPKKVMRVYKKLGINNLADLQNQLDVGEVRRVLGTRLDLHIRQGLDDRPRMLLWSAEKILGPIEERLREIPGVKHVLRVGSLRRKLETGGDLNF